MDTASGHIAVCSLSQARRHKRRFNAVITLEDPACRPANQLRFIKRPAPSHLVLAFEDVDDASLGVKVATRDQVETALMFGRSNAFGSLLVHCFHGVGRSAAVALAILADRSEPGMEAAAVKQLFEMRPEATPNLVVVALADDVLGRGGALIAALARWEAANPAFDMKRRERLELVANSPHLFAWN